MVSVGFFRDLGRDTRVTGIQQGKRDSTQAKIRGGGGLSTFYLI